MHSTNAIGGQNSKSKMFVVISQFSYLTSYLYALSFALCIAKLITQKTKKDFKLIQRTAQKINNVEISDIIKIRNLMINLRLEETRKEKQVINMRYLDNF